MKKIISILISLLLISLPIISLAENNNDYITRAQFIKEILTTEDSSIDDVAKSSFIDVTDPEYIPYIENAYNRDIISGYGDEFKPEMNITKEDAIVVLVKVFCDRYEAQSLSDEDIDKALSFSDKASISSWAKPYIAYAINIGLIDKDSTSLYPKMSLTHKTANDLITAAKNIHDELFTKEGLSASEMLVLSNEKIDEFDTYKQKGTMKMHMKMSVDGVPDETMQEDPEMQKLINEGIYMKVDMDVQVETPNNAYIKETVSSYEGQEELNQEIEIFMNDTTMYTKMMGSEKWISQDISSIMNQIQAYSNNDPYRVSQLSDNELMFFKDYARFKDDTEIDNEEYYVIGININEETYNKYYKDIIEKSIDASIELQANNPELREDPDFDPEMFREMMEQITNQMDVEISYDFYINKDTMLCEKMGIVQDVYMSMDQLLSMMALAEEGEEIPDMSLTMITHSDGFFDFYDFDGEVNFPKIDDEDILDLNVPKIIEDPQF